MIAERSASLRSSRPSENRRSPSSISSSTSIVGLKVRPSGGCFLPPAEASHTRNGLPWQRLPFVRLPEATLPPISDAIGHRRRGVRTLRFPCPPLERRTEPECCLNRLPRRALPAGSIAPLSLWCGAEPMHTSRTGYGLPRSRPDRRPPLARSGRDRGTIQQTKAGRANPALAADA